MISKPAAKKVCYVVCYKDPNYIRTLTLVGALQRLNNIELTVIKNKHKGVLRYLEVPARTLWVRLRYKPDIFIVGFRGHEVFWLLYPSMAGKRIIFDEFINLHDWLINEHRKIRGGSVAAKCIDAYMRWVHKKCTQILEDTEAHARLSESVYGTAAAKFKVIPVGADEYTFRPVKTGTPGKPFEVFFFGNMLPLHGLHVILDAIRLLADKDSLEDVHFTLAGGRGNPQMIKEITNYIKLNKLSNFVTHLEWVPYAKLPAYIAKSDLCLGGPFGSTPQACRVITGKTFQFLAMGKAVVVGKNEASTGFINRQNSLVVPLGEPQQLADTISWAAANRKRVELIGKSGRQLYVKRFSLSVIRQRMGEIIND